MIILFKQFIPAPAFHIRISRSSTMFFRQFIYYSYSDSFIALVSGEGSSPSLDESVFSHCLYVDMAPVLRPSCLRQIIRRW
jgi:hypothetical protein